MLDRGTLHQAEREKASSYAEGMREEDREALSRNITRKREGETVIIHKWSEGDRQITLLCKIKKINRKKTNKK